MAKSEFIGRKRELKLLDNLWGLPRATLLILYGRRRVGKTRLLTHWLKRHSEDGLYWMAEATSALEQLRSFSQAIIHFMDPETPAPEDFTYATWEQALRQVALHARQKRMALFIDEVTYLIDVNPDFVGILQKAWDHWLSESNLMLVLSGSQMGLMQKKVLAYDAPLYGRDTAQVKLPPLPFSATQRFFPEYSASERTSVYAMWGGVPAYWERLDASLSVIENLQYQLVPFQSWMIDEPRTLLQDFITEPHNYVAVLRAIADGLQSLGEISERAGLASNHTSFYLSVLRDAGFVKREVPVSQHGKDSRRGRYYLTDPYLRFYYRFLAPHQSKLALGQQQQALQTVEESLPQFIEANTWQELCREWLVQASDQGEIPLPLELIGSEWKANLTFDVVGIHGQERTLVLGNCYWAAEPVGTDAIDALVRNTTAILPDRRDWTVYFTLFSASGWTAEAQAKAEATVSAQENRGRKRWQSAGIRLLDLEEIDEDFRRWM